jgi:valyl-tRNA synthetase
LRYGIPDLWITSRLHRAVEAVTTAYEQYEFDRAARTLYHFLWSEFCDWYLEMSKVLLQDPDAQEATRYTLWRTLETGLRLLHPIMPFVTEAAWQALPHEGDSLMVASWPAFDPTGVRPGVEEEMELVQEVVREIRSLRADLRTPPGERVAAHVVAGSRGPALQAHKALVEALARARVTFIGESERPRPAAGGVVGPVEVWVPLDRAQAETLAQRARAELEEVDRELERVRARLANPEFLQRAPAEVVEAEQKRLAEAEARREKLVRYLLPDGS